MATLRKNVNYYTSPTRTQSRIPTYFLIRSSFSQHFYACNIYICILKRTHEFVKKFYERKRKKSLHEIIITKVIFLCRLLTKKYVKKMRNKNQQLLRRRSCVIHMFTTRKAPKAFKRRSKNNKKKKKIVARHLSIVTTRAQYIYIRIYTTCVVKKKKNG